MPQSLSKIYVHIVFSTKTRLPFLSNPDIRKQTHAFLVHALKNLDSPALIAGGAEDHVHVLIRLSRKNALSKIIGEAKRSSSKWIKSKGRDLEKFQWQAGYGAFSVSRSKVDQVREYIEGQMEHHKRVTFQEEFRELLQKHGIEFDERYVWD